MDEKQGTRKELAIINKKKTILYRNRKTNVTLLIFTPFGLIHAYDNRRLSNSIRNEDLKLTIFIRSYININRSSMCAIIEAAGWKEKLLILEPIQDDFWARNAVFFLFFFFFYSLYILVLSDSRVYLTFAHRTCFKVSSTLRLQIVTRCTLFQVVSHTVLDLVVIHRRRWCGRRVMNVRRNCTGYVWYTQSTDVAQVERA